ncbi:MAG: T9SS type A sorting domain-containing protein, partial [Candidatus Cloacimonadia bacterium]
MERKANPLSRYMLGKKIIALAICLVGLTGALYAEAGSGPEVKALPAYEPLQLRSALPSTQESESSLPQSRGVTPVLFEDFEAGAPDWYTVDETATPPTWHTDEYNAYGGAGKSWWMGDPEVGPNGGYLDHWYQVLDTPPISLPEAGEIILSFYQFRAIEDPGVNDNFDGWDGFNVRIRLAGQEYAEAAILTDCEPAYNCSSMYSFGFEHGEDPDGVPGIPGWGGSTDGWIPTEIMIPSDYQGQNVIISFAFASDPAYCTSDDPSLTGVFVDNISVGSLYNDGEDETGFYPFSNVPVGGDLWHIYEDSSAPSPTHAEGCFDENTGTYNPNMENFLVSPKIEFPSGTEITWDMYVKTGLDEGVFPNCDYIYVQIRSFMDGEWQPWISISNPTYDPNGTNYVFTGSIEEWYPFSLGWPGYSNISVLAGLADSIQMRVGLHSNADEPTTIGFRVDNFGIYSALEVLPPSNLTGNYVDGNVELAWSPPTGLGGEMQWDDGSFENGIYFSAGTGYMGEEFPVDGACTIEEFTVFGYQFGGATTVGVFEKSEGVYSSTPTYTMSITTQANAPATYQVDWDVQDDFI